MNGTPPRPAIPLPFAFGMALWCGCAGAFTAGRDLAFDRCWAFAVAAIASAVASGIVALAFAQVLSKGPSGATGAGAREAVLGTGSQRRRPFVPLCVAGLALGCALGFAKGAALHDAASAAQGAQADRFVLELCADSSEGAYGEQGYARIVDGAGRGHVVALSLPKGAELLCGDRVAVFGKLKAADFERIPRLWQRCAIGSLSVTEGAAESLPPTLAPLRGLRRAAIEELGQAGGTSALLQALVCGYRRQLAGSELYAAFQTCGLAHLVAVSGAHLVIVTALFAEAFKRARVPRRASAVLLMGAMGSYYVVAGMPVSALRAATMSSVGILAIVGRRRPSSLNALGIAVAAIVAMDPAASVSASLALSGLATLGIVLFAPLLQSLAVQARFVPRWALEALSLTLASSLLAQPYASSLFSQLPLVSPLSNLVAGPLFAPLCALALVAALAGAAHLPLAGAMLLAASASASLFEQLVRALASIPYASVPVHVEALPALAISAAAAMLAWALWERISLAWLLGCAASVAVAFSAYGFATSQADTIAMLDVGQGDAFLVRSAGRSLLIDTGNQDTRLLSQLAQNGVVHIDSVLITHADDDHCGSLDALAQAVDIGRVLVASGIPESDDASCRELVSDARRAAGEVVELSVGDSFSVGRIDMEVVWPSELVDDGGNADSLCLLARYDADADGNSEFSALFTGDAETGEIAQMLERGAVGDVDILKVGHHGSRNGLVAEQAEALSPEIALISVGAQNRYGHPTPETLSLLNGVGAEIFRTDEDGMVTCVLSKDSVRVRIGDAGLSPWIASVE